MLRDVEHIVRDFTGDLRRLALQAGSSVREETLSGLRAILEDTLDRVRDELFSAPAQHGTGTQAQHGTGTPRGGEGMPGSGNGTADDEPGPGATR
jgi:hypothetical protein